MRVHLFADPALAERPGSLQAQLYGTLAALRALGPTNGIEAALAAGPGGRAAACDVLHVFGTGAVEGAIDAARAHDIPVVLSPRLSPDWSRSNGSRARVADRVLGNRSAHDIDSAYAQVRRTLNAARLVLAGCEAERKAICEAFLLDAGKVRVAPNGVAERFFNADPTLFRERARIAGRFALMVGQVSPYANQLGVARALAKLALPLVVIGEARERDAAYLRELRAQRTVTCAGPFAHDDRMLASAYAAASVLVLARRVASMPMALAEALAAGTPAVGCAGLAPFAEGAQAALRQVGCDDPCGLQQAVSDLLEVPPPRDAVSALVRPLSWQRVAPQLAQCYRCACEAPGQVSES
ncbi:MAG: glycosyltransferase family 4 protein [Massilia sp.]